SNNDIEKELAEAKKKDDEIVNGLKNKIRMSTVAAVVVAIIVSVFLFIHYNVNHLTLSNYHNIIRVQPLINDNNWLSSIYVHPLEEYSDKYKFENSKISIKIDQEIIVISMDESGWGETKVNEYVNSDVKVIGIEGKITKR
ncbi:MAG: hypothetical protein IJT67_03020, partial [Lachnospiraceae bacterium]|nr:hypothetical protein [Lachnospiraceae bacterium]